MTSGAPWSVKGIDPKAREIAKDLARRSGMTLGEWLNRMIVEGDAIEPSDITEEYDVHPGPGFDAQPEPIVVGGSRRDAPRRYEVAGHPADEVGRVAEAIERLTARIEAAEQRSTLAITGIDQSVRGALSRLEGAEREQVAVAARFEGALDDLNTRYGGVGERLRRIEMESTGPRSAEALRAIEGMLGKVAGQVYEGESRTRETLAAIEARIATVEAAPAAIVPSVDTTQLAEVVMARVDEAESRTTDALRDLGASFVALDRRLKTVESGSGDGGARLETLAAELTRKMEATRTELAEGLRAASEGRFDRMERNLSEMALHIQAAETRSTQAIERMGREVVNMADSLSRRVQTVENHGADAIEQIGGEVARIATVVEQKLNRADGVQAQALEKLGSEIARITERLAERIANSERRGALAIDEVGEQVARVTERINQRQERSSADLAERIRQSEERTARLLDEAREKIDQSLNASHRRLAEQVAQGPVAPIATPTPLQRRAEIPREPFDPFTADPFEAPGRTIPEEAFAPQALTRPEAAAPLAEPEPFPVAERGPPAFSEEDYEAADGFAPISEDVEIPEAPVFPESPEISPFDADEPARPRTTREVLEQARTAARLANSPEARPAATEKRGLFGAGKLKRRAGSSLQSALVLAAGAATLSTMAAYGVIKFGGHGEGSVAGRVAEALQIRRADEQGEIKTAEADTTPVLPSTPRVAVAVSPQGVGPSTTDAPALAGAPTSTPVTTPVESPASLYADAIRRIDARDLTGVATLKRAANLGYAQAQFYLAKLYENGEAGLRKDPVEARRWTERAALGGDRKAMHNLGLYFFEGQGGTKNTTTAAQWFRKAADLGLSDSQYNLGRLYEEGYGVSQNAAEAYKWYLIAARAGDSEARSSAARVAKDLSPPAIAAAERSAQGFRAASPTATPAGAAVQAAVGGTSSDVTAAQRALSTLGFYRGPQDGVPSQGLKGAIAAFQREQGIPPTGTLDAATMQKLSTYAR